MPLATAAVTVPEAALVPLLSMSQINGPLYRAGLWDIAGLVRLSLVLYKCSC